MNTESKKSPRVAIILVGLLALMQIPRVTAYPIIQDVLSGNYSEAWLFPAMMDVFVGVLALFIAISVWRGKGPPFGHPLSSSSAFQSVTIWTRSLPDC
jgi:hypothetical protein